MYVCIFVCMYVNVWVCNYTNKRTHTHTRWDLRCPDVRFGLNKLACAIDVPSRCSPMQGRITIFVGFIYL